MEENLLNEQYKTKKILSRSLFGHTYLVEDSKNFSEYVIKYTKLKKPLTHPNIKLFKREISVLSNLINNNIPRFIDYFIYENSEQVELFIVQEYISGKNLYELIEEGKLFTEKEVIQIASKISMLLEYTHSFSPSVLHRDIKPSNIILDKDGNPYLIDFVASREKLLSSDLKSKNISTIIGSHGYRPIEQFEGRTYPATDIYSLGCVLIYLLSHKEPFEFSKKNMKIDFKNYVKISTEFEKVIDKMIEPDYFNRYENTLDLRKDLEKVYKDKKISYYSRIIKNKNWFNTFVTIVIFSIITYNFFNDVKNYNKKPEIVIDSSNKLVAKGNINFQNNDFLNIEPTFEFKSKDNNKIIKPIVVYKKGLFKIYDLPQGKYEITIIIDPNPPNTLIYKKTLKYSKDINIYTDKILNLDINLR